MAPKGDVEPQGRSCWGAKQGLGRPQLPVAFRCSPQGDPSMWRAIEAQVSASFAGQQPSFPHPPHSFQEQSVDPGVCRLVGTNRLIKDSWFPSSCLGQCLPETAVGLEHLATPLYVPARCTHLEG